MFTSDRDQLRRFFTSTWRKRSVGEVLEPLEAQVAAVIAEHPEYHRLLERPETAIEAEYLPDLGGSNPFLHMGMHIALREQTATDRPLGISRIYQGLIERLGDRHAAEHAMLECLAETLWQAQRNGESPDERRYLDCLQRL